MAPPGETAEMPDLHLFYSVEAPEKELDDLAGRLASLPTIAGAYVTPAPQPAGADTGAVAYVEEEAVNSMAPAAAEAPPTTQDFTGRQGYLERARRIFDTAFAMQASVKRHAALRLMGRPTFCFSFRSDEFNVYHVNDFMKGRGWRFNGQQDPDAIHMCVTGPQTQPGVVAAFDRDLAEAVSYARSPAQPVPLSAGIYGGGAAGRTDPAAIEAFFLQVMDALTDGAT